MPQDANSRSPNTPFSEMAGQLYPGGLAQDSQNQEGDDPSPQGNGGMASYVTKEGDTLHDVSHATGLQ